MYMKLDIPKVKRESFANRSFNVMGPRLWNEIPNEAKQCVDVETFNPITVGSIGSSHSFRGGGIFPHSE